MIFIFHVLCFNKIYILNEELVVMVRGKFIFIYDNNLFLEQINSNEQMMTTSDTMKDANETLSKCLIFNFLSFLLSKALY